MGQEEGRVSSSEKLLCIRYTFFLRYEATARDFSLEQFNQDDICYISYVLEVVSKSRVKLLPQFDKHTSSERMTRSVGCVFLFCQCDKRFTKLF